LIAHFGVAVCVRLDNGGERIVRVRRNSGHVVGDRVCVGDDQLQRLERRNALQRESLSGGTHTVGVNLDLLAIVVAPMPETPRSFIDRALVAALTADIQPALIINKADIDGFAALHQQLTATYGRFCPILPVCAKRAEGLEELRALFAPDRRGAFVGTSGVGKSSLINVLVPDLDLRVGDIRERSGLGRHTTTVATLQQLPGGGELVDTPGFRDFGLVNVTPLDLAHHFPDFTAARSARCRFRDCLHYAEPDCAVRERVEDGRIAESRYQAYLELLREARDAANRLPPTSAG
jgi:ribosome biogenesis GTPase